ncbi:MAG: EamA/RhaT family transporter, partial [Bryobacteraceae bacterium]
SSGVYMEVIGGSVLMVAGAAVIAFSSASGGEFESWKAAARRETERYRIDPEYVAARMEGRDLASTRPRRTWFDWLIVAVATLIFVALGAMAKMPNMHIQMSWLAGLIGLTVLFLLAAGWALWRVTKFS